MCKKMIYFQVMKISRTYKKMQTRANVPTHVHELCTYSHTHTHRCSKAKDKHWWLLTENCNFLQIFNEIEEVKISYSQGLNGISDRAALSWCSLLINLELSPQFYPEGSCWARATYHSRLPATPSTTEP